MLRGKLPSWNLSFTRVFIHTPIRVDVAYNSAREILRRCLCRPLSISIKFAAMIGGMHAIATVTQQH